MKLKRMTLDEQHEWFNDFEGLLLAHIGVLNDVLSNVERLFLKACLEGELPVRGQVADTYEQIRAKIEGLG